MTAQQSATEAQCPTAQQSASSTAQQITTYTKLPNRVCPKAFVQHKSNFKSKSNTICPTLKSPPRKVALEFGILERNFAGLVLGHSWKYY